MDIKETLKHAWRRLVHLNILRADSKQNNTVSAPQGTNKHDITLDNSRDYQNTKPGEHVYTRRPNSRGSRTL